MKGNAINVQRAGVITGVGILSLQTASATLLWRTGEVFRFLRRRVEERKERSAAHQKARETVAELEAIAADQADTIGAEAAQNIVHAFRERLTQIHCRSEAPPLALARIEWDTFEENAKEFKARSLAEIERSMSEWIVVSAEIGCNALVYQVIDIHLTRIEAEMYSAAADEIENFAEEVEKQVYQTLK